MVLDVACVEVEKFWAQDRALHTAEWYIKRLRGAAVYFNNTLPIRKKVKQGIHYGAGLP